MSGLLPISCLHISKDRFSVALRYGYAKVGLWFEVYTNESPQIIRLFHIVYKFSWIFNTFSQHFNSNILINGTISIYVTSKLFLEIYVGQEIKEEHKIYGDSIFPAFIGFVNVQVRKCVGMILLTQDNSKFRSVFEKYRRNHSHK